MIALPEPRDAATPAGNRGRADDQLGGDRLPQDTGNDTVTAAAAQGVLGFLLRETSADLAAAWLRRLPPEYFVDPVHLWARAAIAAAAERGVVVNPVTATEAARRAKLPVPPALLGRVVTELAIMALNAPGAALMSHLTDILGDHHARRTVEVASGRMQDAAWRGELGELAELVQAEAAKALAAISAVSGDGR